MNILNSLIKIKHIFNIKKYIYVVVGIFFINIIFNNSFVYSQYSSYEQKYKLAESFEKGGNIDGAAKLYKELYSASPKTVKYFEAIVRIYKRQNRFSELNEIVVEQLKNNKTVDLLILKGELEWRLGETDKANNTWKESISFGTNISEVYFKLSETLNSLRLFDKSISVLKEAKKKFPFDINFSDRLAKLYVLDKNYVDGIAEILFIFRNNKDIQMAQSKIFNFLDNKEATNYINKEFQKEIKKDDNLQLLSLYGWYLRASKDFNKALEIFVQIEERTKSRGLSLYKFAEDSKKDGEYDVALKAFQKVISMGKNTDYRHSALFMYTKTIEEKMQASDSISKKETEDIINRYKEIIKEFPKTNYEIDCRFRIADLENSILKNVNNAIEELNKIVSFNYNSFSVVKALNNLSDIYIENNNLEESEKINNQLLSKYGRQTSQNIIEEINKAKFIKGQLLFYNEKMDSAFAVFKQLSDDLETDIANDALDKVVLIEQNKDFITSLNMFAKAELAIKQNNIELAIKCYQEVIRYTADEQIGEQSIIKIAELEIKRLNFDNANNILTNYLAEKIYPMYGDNALFLLGNIAEKQNNQIQAIEYYTSLLEKYINSLFLIEARQRIKELRIKV